MSVKYVIVLKKALNHCCLIMNAPKKIKFTHLVLISFFLGIFGIDRLILGYKNWWIKAITLGGCSVWALLDLISIVTFKMKMGDGTDLKTE